jgi:DNA repair exonuclease SbcCD ATPase subunit
LSTNEEYLTLSKKIDELDKQNFNLNDELTPIKNEYDSIENEKTKISEDRDKANKIKEAIQKLREEKAGNISTIAIHQSRISIIDSSEIMLARLNQKIDEEISSIRVDIKSIEAIKLGDFESKLKIDNDVKNSNDRIKQYEQSLIDYKNYRVAESSLKLYKKLLSKDGLPQHIFSVIVPIINKMLNDDLETVDFRLIFHPEYLDLRFIDVKRNTMRPIQFISGMQETIVGLSITSLLITLNQSMKFNFMFIDEVSGKVTDGSQLTYESKNYKKILATFIQRLSEKINIYIIDPVLVYKDERILEVQPGENGSTIQEIEYAMK